MALQDLEWLKNLGCPDLSLRRSGSQRCGFPLAFERWPRSVAAPGPRGGLEAAGFVGWVTFEALIELGEAPQTGGVYVVVQTAGTEPAFLASNLLL